jgi:ABC-2 type transport system permease protein
MNMNLRGGTALIKGSIMDFTTSKGIFWTLAFGWMSGPLIYMFVWSMAAGQGTIGGYGRKDFIFYYLCLIFINQLTYPTAHWSTSESIQNGSMSNTLLRPLPVFYGAAACDLSVKLVCMPFVAVIVIVLGLVTGLSFTLSLTGVLISAVSLLFALVIRFMLAYILALLAFWTQNTASLLSVNDTFIFLLAGQVAPISLFPGFLRSIAFALPYRYMLSFPVEVLMGKTSGTDLLYGLAMQLFWVAALFLLHHFVYKFGVKRYTATGG